MKYTLKNNKNELLEVANDLSEKQTVLFWLVFIAFSLGLLF